MSIILEFTSPKFKKEIPKMLIVCAMNLIFSQLPLIEINWIFNYNLSREKIPKKSRQCEWFQLRLATHKKKKKKIKMILTKVQWNFIKHWFSWCDTDEPNREQKKNRQIFIFYISLLPFAIFYTFSFEKNHKIIDLPVLVKRWALHISW